MKLFLVRHGESEGNLVACYHGQTDLKLTGRGRQQAEAIQPILFRHKFDKIYSSDLTRTCNTCELAIPGAIYEPITLLREYDVGSLAGKPLMDLEPFQADPAVRPDYTYFGGENITMVRGRARAFLNMLEASDYTCVAAFSHFGFINCVLSEVLGVNYPRETLKTGNCAIHVLEFDGKIWKIAALNYMTPVDC